MKSLTINLKNTQYDIIIENDLLFHLAFYVEKVYHNSQVFIITDDKVGKLYLEKVKKSLSPRFEAESIIIASGESSKCLEVYSEVIEKLLAKGIRRNHLIIALGGGVVGDLAGFVAATLYRGIPYINIPTTLLSQIDSAIGGKTGLDFLGQKNVIGAFNQPALVLIDPKALNTLSKRELNNGVGELIKHALIGSKDLFVKLQNNVEIDEEIIYESLCVKKMYVEADELDQKERMFLNFGHTFGHLLELEKNLKHGEAVGLGMLMAIDFGVELKITCGHIYTETKALLKAYDLPNDEPDYHLYLPKIKDDKKNIAGKINFILLKDIGNALIYELYENRLKEFV